jgi:hypothetical protein
MSLLGSSSARLLLNQRSRSVCFLQEEYRRQSETDLPIRARTQNFWVGSLVSDRPRLASRKSPMRPGPTGKSLRKAVAFSLRVWSELYLRMSTTPPPSPSHSNPPSSREFDADDDTIDLRDLFRRLSRGAFQLVGLAFIGVVLAALITLVLNRAQPVATTTRVAFSFPGFERGEYPDKSKFSPDDLRAPSVVAEALKRQGLDTSGDFQSKVRGGIEIEGIVPLNITKERDRQRAAGQTPPAYVPDEYTLTLALGNDTGLSNKQRERLVTELVSVYRENFNRTYSHTPLAFGTAFETLRNADFPEYEIIFSSEIDSIKAYLVDQIGQDPSQTYAAARAKRAASFRSQATNFSFKDLLEQTNLFAQIQLNETLGLIHENGLSRNRATAMMKMNFYLRQLEDREKQAAEEEKVVRDLLTETQSRAQNVVLGVKSQAGSRPDSTVVDQGLVDSLLANDAYNFLVRRALDAGLQVKRIQAEKNKLLDLRDNIKSFMQSAATDQSAIISQVQVSLKNLETNYTKLIDNIRRTHADYIRQEYGDAVRLSDQVRTPGLLRPLAIAGIVGGALGFALGAGLSLLGIYIGKLRTA